jgi:hypothetical protein
MNSNKRVESHISTYEDGIVIDLIELNAEKFGFFAKSGVSEKIIRDEIARAVADKLILDYEFITDPSVKNGSFVRVSSKVYMKPEYKETLTKVRDNLVQLRETHIEEREAQKELIQELMGRNEKALREWAKYSDLYFEYLGKDNDYVYLFKRAWKLFWYDIKIKFSELVRWVPRF